MPNVKETVRSLEAELKSEGSSERAEGEKKYLKSDLDFFGVGLGPMGRIAKDYLATANPDHDELMKVVVELWRKPIFERRMTGVILLERRASSLESSDLDLVEELVRRSKTWALVDGLAVNVVGSINLRYKIKTRLDRCARDENFWIRRTSLLAEIKPLKAGAPFGPFAARADRMLEEKEFFIRKAIGWVLRETSKTRPDEVYEWIAPRTHRASGVTMRETVRYLGDKRSKLLMDAYKAKRPVTR